MAKFNLLKEGWGIEVYDYEHDESKIKKLKWLLECGLVLIIKDRRFRTTDEFGKFASIFGELAIQYPKKEKIIKQGEPEASLDAHSFISWHADGGFLRRPFSYVSLYIEDIASGASGTKWINMIQAYDALDINSKEYLKYIEALHTVNAHTKIHAEKDDGTYIHKFQNERQERIMRKKAQAKHPLIQTTLGRKHLYFNDYVEEDSIGTGLYNQLKTHCYSEKFMLEYEWEPGDFVIFSNFMTIHGRDATAPEIMRKVWKAQII